MTLQEGQGHDCRHTSCQIYVKFFYFTVEGFNCKLSWFDLCPLKHFGKPEQDDGVCCVVMDGVSFFFFFSAIYIYIYIWYGMWIGEWA